MVNKGDLTIIYFRVLKIQSIKAIKLKHDIF